MGSIWFILAKIKRNSNFKEDFEINIQNKKSIKDLF
jgi:hypothetical protein